MTVKIWHMNQDDSTPLKELRNVHAVATYKGQVHIQLDDLDDEEKEEVYCMCCYEVSIYNDKEDPQ